MTYLRLHAEEHALEIHVHDSLEVRFRDLMKRDRRRQDSGVVERAVQASEGGATSRDQRRHLVGLRDITLDEGGTTARFLDRPDRVGGPPIDVADHDGGSRPGKGQRRRPPDAGAGTRNQHHLARKILRHIAPANCPIPDTAPPFWATAVAAYSCPNGRPSRCAFTQLSTRCG